MEDKHHVKEKEDRLPIDQRQIQIPFIKNRAFLARVFFLKMMMIITTYKGSQEGRGQRDSDSGGAGRTIGATQLILFDECRHHQARRDHTAIVTRQIQIVQWLIHPFMHSLPILVCRFM